MVKYSSLGVAILDLLSGSKKRHCRGDFNNSGEILNEQKIDFSFVFEANLEWHTVFGRDPKVTPEMFFSRNFLIIIEGIPLGGEFQKVFF